MKWRGVLALLGVSTAAPSALLSTPVPLAKKPAHAASKPVKPGGAAKAGKDKKGKALRAAKRRPSGPSYQLHPDPERYAEIQRALADRGYFHGEATGEWNVDSTDALKRFQADQKLPDDGKITALTLSGLGLGPHHDGSTAVTVPLPNAAPSEPSVSGSTVGPAASPVKKEPQPSPGTSVPPLAP